MKGDWTVELTEFRNSKLIKTTDQEIFVYCSVCDDSIVGGSQKPLLRRIVLKNNNNVVFERPYRIPLRINDLGDTSTSHPRYRRARKSTIKLKRNHAQRRTSHASAKKTYKKEISSGILRPPKGKDVSRKGEK